MTEFNEYVPVMAKTVQKRTIRNIERSLDGRFKYFNFVKIIYNSESSTECCAICQCEYTDHEHVRILKCKHMYHKKCIDKWLSFSDSCPMCRCNVFN